MAKTTKTKMAGWIGDKFIAKDTALTSSQFFNWRSGSAPKSPAPTQPKLSSQPPLQKQINKPAKQYFNASDAEQRRIKQNNRRINNLFTRYGYTSEDADRNYWADKAKTNTYGTLEDNLKRRKEREQTSSTAGKSVGTDKDKLYIGATNWGTLQTKFSSKQLEYATETIGGKKYWRSDRAISDYKPENLSDVTNIINANQDSDFAEKQAESEPPIRESVKDTIADLSKGTEEAKKILGGGDDRPEAPDLADLYKRLTSGDQGEVYKTTELEENLTFWKDQERDIQSRMEERMEYEEGKPVAMGVISGKTSEIARQEQKNLDFANREIAHINDQLKTKYGMIEMVMNFTSLDFQNASNAYDTDFSQTLSTLNFVKGITTEEKTQREKDEDNARANIQIISNSLTKGEISFGELDDTQKNNIRKLEIEAGLPSGFIENLKNANPSSNILSTTTRTDPYDKKYIDIVTKDADGKLSVQSILAGSVKVSSPSSNKTDQKAEQEAQEKNNIKSSINNITGDDKKVDPKKMQQIRQNVAVNAPKLLKWFDDAYPPSTMLNPEHDPNFDYIDQDSWTPKKYPE